MLSDDQPDQTETAATTSPAAPAAPVVTRRTRKAPAKKAAAAPAGDASVDDAADGSALLGGAAVRQGRDAQVTVGDTIVATSPSNTFAELVPGVTITLAAGAAAGTTSQVTLARDPGATTAAAPA